jgi:hypothetical protein
LADRKVIYKNGFSLFPFHKMFPFPRKYWGFEGKSESEKGKMLFYE